MVVEEGRSSSPDDRAMLVGGCLISWLIPEPLVGERVTVVVVRSIRL
jgi:hypothetical protein